MHQDGYTIGNADLTIMLQAPRLAPHIDSMQKTLAEDLNCEAVQINLKATTTEKLGFIGREEGVAAEAVVLLQAF